MPSTTRSRRQRIPSGRSGSPRFIRRDRRGRFTENQAGVGTSLRNDRRRKAKRTVPKGQGDRGDQHTR